MFFFAFVVRNDAQALQACQKETFPAFRASQVSVCSLYLVLFRGLVLRWGKHFSAKIFLTDWAPQPWN